MVIGIDLDGVVFDSENVFTLSIYQITQMFVFS